jgi:CheY-like chemotaxis protein/two-component sensor histidine kinase
MQLERAPLSIALLVESTAEILAPSAFKKGLRLVPVVDPALPSVLMGDPVRLRQILFNLVGNAVKFTEAGRVEIRAELIENLPGQARLRLSVTDTGIGIPPDVQDKLFRPFSQADETTTRRFGGTGLGLSICRHLVDLMGGTIGLDSEAGRGSTFHVTLTLGIGAPCAADQPLPRLDGLVARVSLDHPAEREAAERYLVAAGARLAQPDEKPGLLIIEGEGATPDPAIPTVQVAKREQPGSAPALASIARPLRRSGLLRAATRALGRDEPSLSETKPAKTLLPQAAANDERLILVAEDNPVNRMVISRLLQLLGRKAEIFPDGKVALEAWRSGRYALVLTDCHMPEMDGFALSRAIREAEQGSGRYTPIVAFTAAATSDEVDQCTEAGMDDFLPKPVDLERLKSSLSHWLDRDA